MPIKILSLTLLLVPALMACQAVPRPDAGGAVTRAPGDEDIVLPEGRRYVVLSHQSEARIIAYPAGSLARAGHPHVIGGAVIDGEIVVAEDFRDSGLRLSLDVSALDLDRPEWRSDEGFEPEMPESAIQDTRSNMLSDEQLDAESHPRILIESLGLTGPHWQPDVEVRITLAGTARELTVPVALRFNDHELEATGRFVIRQSDFGIEPFSAAGGNLRVADEVLVRFRVLAMANGSRG
ncbi:MAG: YceI family protein [Wenzhouxiangella sp.]